jgi:hypothetical protein
LDLGKLLGVGNTFYLSTPAIVVFTALNSPQVYILLPSLTIYLSDLSSHSLNGEKELMTNIKHNTMTPNTNMAIIILQNVEY